MDRRTFLAAFGQRAAAAAAVGAGAAVVASERSIDAVSRLYDDLKKRVDEMETSHKKMLRAILIVTSVSTGMDVASLL